MAEKKTKAQLASRLSSALGDRLVAAYRVPGRYAAGVPKEKILFLVIVDHIDLELLRAARPFVRLARRRKAVLRLQTLDDVRRSQEFLTGKGRDLIAHRTVVAGKDVLEALDLDPAELRLHAELGLRDLRRRVAVAILEGELENGGDRKMSIAFARLAGLLVDLLAALGEERPPEGDHAALQAAASKALGSAVSEATWATMATMRGPGEKVSREARYKGFFEITDAALVAVSGGPSR